MLKNPKSSEYISLLFFNLLLDDLIEDSKLECRDSLIINSCLCKNELSNLCLKKLSLLLAIVCSSEKLVHLYL